MEHWLHFFEGIPGSGKTTRAQWLEDDLIKEGRKYLRFYECEKNPLDLARYVILSPSEFLALKTLIIENASGDMDNANIVLRDLEAISEYFDNQVYIAFQALYEKDSTKSIAYGLSARDVYNGHLSFERFRDLHIKRWTHFSKNARHDETIYICDAILFQSPLFALLGYYDMQESAILRYIRELVACVKSLNPIVHYIKVSNVSSLMQQTCIDRKNAPDKWERGFYKRMEATPYFQSHNYHGFSGMCAFLEERQSLELKLLDQIGIPFVIHDRNVG